MIGWIKLHRQFIEWEWYTDNNVKAIFIHCLLSANVERKEWRGISIDRGMFVTSISKLAIDTGLSIKAVRIALDKLKKTSEIKTEGASHWTTITVCKYEIYQGEREEQGQTNGKQKGEVGANKGQTKGKQRATTKEYKNDKNDKNDKNIVIAEAEASTLYQDFISAYDLFVKEKVGTPAKINGLQGKSAKEIISYLRTAVKQKNPLAGDADILDAWKYILDKYQKWDSFYRGNLDLNQINKNLVNIINSIKNGTNRRGKEPATDFNDIGKLVELGFRSVAIPEPTTGNG